MTMSGRYMACGHCGGLRRVRVEGEFVSCDSCGKVLQQRGRKQRAVDAEARRRRRRRWLGARKRRDDRAVAGGGGMVVGREASDAESDTGCVSSVESSS
ncbi:hypothetical protein D1007_14999 [Hordeum vulgare]|uniref:Predicted protein n=1 Tax=Hordeum vulgare subsp. vulgare TaxID=112509 RepID=F2EBM0_HORVV|nr:uncharacterized protein LOC123412687 [Hordeum vulgare subsp. vulgare]KAE8808605.1 hypothetical protein D1007_14999 [Hordeum vulgare]KAI5018475.1 hypothetical protein ZWY2020_043363 [Hordeum vulgare]BAK04742.1 predicted protein [Hordeum vulgare subsp. vulgare]